MQQHNNSNRNTSAVLLLRRVRRNCRPTVHASQVLPNLGTKVPPGCRAVPGWADRKTQFAPPVAPDPGRTKSRSFTNCTHQKSFFPSLSILGTNSWWKTPPFETAAQHNVIVAGFHNENRIENWPITMRFGPTLVETWNCCPKTNVMRRNWCPKLASKLLPKTPLQFSSSNKFVMKLQNKNCKTQNSPPFFWPRAQIRWPSF
jgi:hypothetical protein